MSSTVAFFIACAATAITAVLCFVTLKLETFNRAKLRKLRESHRGLSDALEKNMPHFARMRLAIQLQLFAVTGIAILSFALWYHFSRWMPFLKYVTIFVVMLAAFLLVRLLDLLLSLKNTARLIRWNANFSRLGFWAFAPLLLPIEYCEKLKRQKLHADAGDGTVITVEDEILSLVEDDAPDNAAGESAGGPVDDLESNEKRMLNGVINLDKTLVHEIMTPRVDIDAISANSSVADAKSAITRSGHSRIPVFDKSIDTICGILYAKDLLNDTRTAKASSLRELAHPPVFIPETKNVGELLDEFRLNRIHLAVVLDEYGGTSGIVTIEDILEEIVGEIEDEYDRTATNAIGRLPNEDGTILTNARMTISQLNQLFDLDISEEEGYDTLGGYIMAMLGRIPKIGEVVLTPELEIEILNASPRQLSTVRIRRRAGSPETPPSHE